MRARDLVQMTPAVHPDDRVVDALRVLATSGLPGLIVSDGSTLAVIPASQVLRVALPQYVLDDPSLGRVWDEQSADALAQRLIDRRVADLVASLSVEDGRPDPTVDADATVVEMAAVMSSAHVPLLAVLDDGRYVGVVTVNALVGRLIA